MGMSMREIITMLLNEQLFHFPSVVQGDIIRLIDMARRDPAVYKDLSVNAKLLADIRKFIFYLIVMCIVLHQITTFLIYSRLLPDSFLKRLLFSILRGQICLHTFHIVLK